MTAYDPPHLWVAEQIDFSVAGVSLLRAGKRKPSRETMVAIEKAFGWPVSEQVDSWDDYAEQFNQRLMQKYAEKEKI